MIHPDDRLDALADELSAANELVTQLRGELAIMAAEVECYRGGQNMALEAVDRMAARMKAAGMPVGLDADI